jgi:hypothetical protein
MNKKRTAITIGIVAVVVVLVVVFEAMLANHQPAITSLEAEPARVLVGGTSQVVCNATDRDGDNLIYGWSASGGAISGQGAKITWYAPRTAGSYNITVIVTDGRGGVATKYKVVEVRANKPPVINNLTADKEWTIPSGSLNVTCIASDTDNDVLTYEWSASGGSITGTGREVTWNAPRETGIYYITVEVSDPYGGKVTRTLPLSVAQEQPPIIKELLITADHCYLRTNTSPYKVGQGKQYHIQCVVSDTDVQLSYQWSCTSGEISGEGSAITWVAPNTSGTVTITVVVSDPAGNKAVRDLVLDVASCNSCTFPGCSAG